MADGKMLTMEAQITRSQTIVARCPPLPQLVSLGPSDIMMACAMPVCMFSLFWPASPSCDEHMLLISLGAVLDGYPSFVGRLQPGGKILTTNQGFPVSCGASPRSLSDFLPSGPIITPHTPVDLREFIAHVSPVPTPESPLLSISIAHLKCRGLAIIVTFHHLLGDTHSLRQFMHDWTSMAQRMAAGDSPSQIIPYSCGRLPLDRFVNGLSSQMSPPEPLRPSLESYTSPWIMIPKEDTPVPSIPAVMLPTILIFFSKERLMELKALAMEDIHQHSSGDNPGLAFVSSNDAMTARLRQVLAALPCRGPSRPTSFFFACDQRDRVEANTGTSFVEQSYVGTCVSMLCTAPMDSSTATLGQLASSTRAVINSAHENICKEYAWMTEQERRFGYDHLWTALMAKVDFNPEFPDFGITNWHFKEPVDFGFGPAVWMQAGLYLPGGEAGVAFPALHPELAGGVFVELHASQTVIGELLAFEGTF